MKLWIWQGFQIELPEEWEMLQFSTDQDKGVCAFADRYQFRFEFDWKRVAGPPDFDRMIGDYEAKLKSEYGMEDFRRMRTRHWHGLEGEIDGQVITRYGRFFEKGSWVVEAVFLWPDRPERELFRAVLKSIEEPEPAGDGPERWLAFGMDMAVSPGFPLYKCTVEPANVEMVFSEGKNRGEERFSRRGMLSEWLDTGVNEWLKSRIPHGYKILSERAGEVCGHSAWYIRSDHRVIGLGALIGRRITRKDCAWICSRDGRLYSSSISSILPRNRDISERTGLACCRKVGMLE